MTRLVGFFLFAKRRVTLSDLYCVFESVGEAVEALKLRKFLRAYFAYKDIVRALTTRKRFIFAWDLLSLKKIFLVVGLRNKNSDTSKEPKELMQNLLELGAALAAETGGTPWQKLKEITTDEVEIQTRNLQKVKAEKLRLMALAFHDTKALNEYLTQVENSVAQSVRDSRNNLLPFNDRIKKAIERSPNINRVPKPHEASVPPHLKIVK